MTDGKEEAMKLWLKQCPRCRGDLYLEQDAYDKYLACLQCGRTVRLDEKSGPVLAKPASTTAGTRPCRETVTPAA